MIGWRRLGAGSAALCAVAAVSAGRAAAAPVGPAAEFSYALNVGAASDYLFRGVDQTDRGVEGFGGVDLDYGDLYVGTWASNVDFRRFGDTRTDAEIDIYGGWRPELKGFDLDLGLIYYGYVDQPGGIDYVEGYAKASRSIGPVSFGAAVYASPNYSGPAGGGYYVEGNAAYRITPKWSVSGAVGRQYRSDGVSGGTMCFAACQGPLRDLGYETWNIGLGYAVSDKIGLDLRYTDTDAHDLGSPFGARLLLSVKATLP